MSRYIFKPEELSLLVRCIDFSMSPLMRVCSGRGFFEKPQRTHWWNNHHLSDDVAERLDLEMTVKVSGTPRATSKGFVHFHIPLLGGWTNTVTIAPVEMPAWGCHYGWLNEEVFGLSRILQKNPARLLIGPSETTFWAVDIHGNQVPLKIIGYGEVGSHDSENYEYDLL